jgi:hypothetical protein
MDPLNINPKNLVGAWYKDAMLEEDDGVLTIKLCHNHMKEEGTMEPLDRSMDRNIMAAIRMLNNVDDLWVERQFVKTNPNAAFEPQQMLLGRRLETMGKPKSEFHF